MARCEVAQMLVHPHYIIPRFWVVLQAYDVTRGPPAVHSSTPRPLVTSACGPFIGMSGPETGLDGMRPRWVLSRQILGVVRCNDARPHAGIC